ncbi:MAG: hypothetical protein K0U74_01150 [Alphaproteobacteria bacterium]|nr:hypothetical protein [Alphaproteobacteria bacterium]
MTIKPAGGLFAALLIAFAAFATTPSVTLAKDKPATATKTSEKKSAAKSKKATSKPKKAKAAKKKSTKPKTTAKSKQTGATSAKAKKPAGKKSGAKKQTAKKSGTKKSSPCQGLAKTACAAKNCIWVKATTVNGKPRKAYCRKRPDKKN